MQKKIKFRLPALLAGLLALVMVLAGCGGKKDSQPQAAGGKSQKKISLKIADIVTNPVYQVALREGIFEKHGIEAEIITFATPAEGINAMFIGQVNVGYGADFPVLSAASKGDYVIIANTGTGLSDKEAARWILFVQEDIRSPADLKGKKLSTLRGTFQPYLWDEFLKENQVSPEEVNFIGQGGFDEIYIALKSGEIDAAWVTGSAAIERVSAIKGVLPLTDMSQTSVRIGGGIIVAGNLLRENPQGITNFLKAVEEASQFVKANPDRTADILYEAVKQPRENTLKDLETNNFQIQFTEKSYESMNKQKKYMVDTGIIQNDFELADKINLDPLKQAVPDRVTFNP